MIDYAFGAALIALPVALGWNSRAARLSIGAGLTTLGISAITKYEWGLVPLLPMRAHLTMDAAETSALMAAPRMLGENGRAAGRILAALGLFGAAVGAMTKTESPLERRELPA
jgi:hypothetical protein